MHVSHVVRKLKPKGCLGSDARSYHWKGEKRKCVWSGVVCLSGEFKVAGEVSISLCC